MNELDRKESNWTPPSISLLHTNAFLCNSILLSPCPFPPSLHISPSSVFFQFFTAHQRLWMVDNSSYFVPLASITPVRVWGGWAERTATVSDPQMSCKVTGRTVEIFIWADDDCALKALKYARFFFFFLFIGFHVRAKVAMAHFTHYR